MAAWARMRHIVVSRQETRESILMDEMQSIKEEEDVASLKGTRDRRIVDFSEICRTPMGDYIVPEGKKPLTSLGYSYPGPADYLPKVELTKSAAPHYSIVGKPKRLDGKRYIPGPFEYNCSGDSIWKNKAISMKGRAKTNTDVEAEKSIGVLGKYKVEYKSIGTEGPKFKMGTKVQTINWPICQAVDSHGFQTPGPNYRPNSSYWGRGHKKSFGQRLKDTRKPKEIPGPADYDVNTESRGPSYSFGAKLPEPVSVQQTVNKISPAANTYDIGTTIGKAPAVSISGREKEPVESKKGPCPATYYPVRSAYNKYKAASLTYKWFEVNEPSRPGPADYNVKHSNLTKSPLYSCRQRVKHSYPDTVYGRIKTEGPGPGAYQTVQSFAENDKPAFSFRKRLKDRAVAEKENVPGPNSYHAEDCEKPESTKAPAFSMAKRLKPPNSMKDTPGPGEYYPKQKSSAPKYTMTRRPQGKGTFVNPAPNRYILPEAIASKTKGVVLKSRASPYIYSGYRTTKLMEPLTLPEINV